MTAHTAVQVLGLVVLLSACALAQPESEQEEFTVDSVEEVEDGRGRLRSCRQQVDYIQQTEPGILKLEGDDHRTSFAQSWIEPYVQPCCRAYYFSGIPPSTLPAQEGVCNGGLTLVTFGCYNYMQAYEGGRCASHIDPGEGCCCCDCCVTTWRRQRFLYYCSNPWKLVWVQLRVPSGCQCIPHTGRNEHSPCD